MLRRMLSRKGVKEQQLKTMLGSVEERGSAYLPQVNAFHIREFQMMYAAEDATRFLHHACRGLPQRLNGDSTTNGLHEDTSAALPLDLFSTRVIDNALAYFC